MNTTHPVHTLQAHLENARLQAVEALAAKGSPLSPDSLRELANLQSALTAVREEISAHGAKLGWGSGEELK